MRRIPPVAVVTVVALLAVSPADAQTQSAVEREIIKLEHDWTTAEDKKDRATLEKLLADDLIGTDSDGNIRTKSEQIAHTMLDEGNVAAQSYSQSEFKVRVDGDVAVVTWSDAWKRTVDGKDRSGGGRGTDLWVKRDGRWQLVSYHTSRIAQK